MTMWKWGWWVVCMVWGCQRKATHGYYCCRHAE